jgi:hypothetical protein
MITSYRPSSFIIHHSSFIIQHSQRCFVICDMNNKERGKRRARKKDGRRIDFQNA